MVKFKIKIFRYFNRNNWKTLNIFSVAARRRCSLKEIEMEKAEDEEELKEDIVKDGFNPDGTNPNLLGVTGGSQTVASKSLLGVNVAVNPTARFRQKSSSEKEKVNANSRSSSSRSSSAESLKVRQTYANLFRC